MAVSIQLVFLQSADWYIYLKKIQDILSDMS